MGRGKVSARSGSTILAITDDLTGFFNRRGFLAAAAQQLKLAQRDRLNVLLFFCDLDDLKGINDSFGHGKAIWHWFAQPTHWKRHFVIRTCWRD